MRYADRAIKKEYMKKKTILLLALFLATSIWAQPTFIRNVNLVDVRNGKIIPAQTIVINGKKIEQIGASSEIAPISGASTIDGSGKYLMPGMTDAHIHFFQSGGLYTRPDAVDLRKKVPYERERDFGVRNAADYLSRYLRLGITSVVDVGGPMSNFAIRDTVGKSGLFPNILATGPLFSMIESDKFGNEVGYEGSSYFRMSQLESIENIGDTVRVQDFRTNESYLGLIEELDFINKTPEDKRFSGFGGTLLVTIRTV